METASTRPQQLTCSFLPGSVTVRCPMLEPSEMDRHVVINGSKGSLRVDNPMSPQSGHRLTVEYADGRRRDETFTHTVHLCIST